MNATPILEGCLEQGSTLQRTPQRAISMCMALVEVQAAQHTKTGHAICAIGNLELLIVN